MEDGQIEMFNSEIFKMKGAVKGAGQGQEAGGKTGSSQDALSGRLTDMLSGYEPLTQEEAQG